MVSYKHWNLCRRYLKINGYKHHGTSGNYYYIDDRDDDYGRGSYLNYFDFRKNQRLY